MKDRTDLRGSFFIAAVRTLQACLAATLILTINPTITLAQQNDTPQQRPPMLEWSKFKQARYGDTPLLVHLRIGSERAILMPEPIRIQEGTELPGTAIEIDTDVIGFFPTRAFPRQSAYFVGLESGTVYELRIRASTQGLLQPLRITR